MSNKLYQCPYEKATKCCLEDPCLYCETFGEHQNELNKKENCKHKNTEPHYPNTYTTATTPDKKCLDCSCY